MYVVPMFRSLPTFASGLVYKYVERIKELHSGVLFRQRCHNVRVDVALECPYIQVPGINKNWILTEEERWGIDPLMSDPSSIFLETTDRSGTSRAQRIRFLFALMNVTGIKGYAHVKRGGKTPDMYDSISNHVARCRCFGWDCCDAMYYMPESFSREPRADVVQGCN